MRAFYPEAPGCAPRPYLQRQVGNGGDGPPDYGMLPLGLNAIDDIPANEILPNIQRPFSFDTHWVWEGEEPLDAPRRRRALTPAANTRGGALTKNSANMPDFPKAKKLATQERHLDVIFVMDATQYSFYRIFLWRL